MTWIEDSLGKISVSKRPSIAVESVSLPVLNLSEKEDPIPPTLDEMDLNKENLEAIQNRAKPKEWVIPNYIGALEDGVEWEPTDTAICVADIHGNINVVWEAKETIVSAQSTVKVFLYLYALSKWADSKDIALWEAVAKKFNEDPITTWNESSVNTAYHPLNNAWWISSAWEIDDWDDFMDFMKKLSWNKHLSVLENIYESEKESWESNLRISASLASKWRFPRDKMMPALDAYTKACSIWLTVKDLTNIWLVMAKWWIWHDGNRLFDQDIAVRAMNAMNSFGFYEATWRMTLLQSWSRPLTAKSWVWWLVIHVNPWIWAFATLWRYLDEAGNSVFGMKAAIQINDMLGTSWAMRLSWEQTWQMLWSYINDVQQYTVREASDRRMKNTFNKSSFLLDKSYIETYQRNLNQQTSVNNDLLNTLSK